MAGKFFLYDYSAGDIVKMKKGHPCGSFEWEIILVGAECRLKCCKCGHMVDMKRSVLEKATLEVRSKGVGDDGK